MIENLFNSQHIPVLNSNAVLLYELGTNNKVEDIN